MNKIYIIILLIFHSLNLCAQFQKKPLWQDEFNGKGSPNTAMWTRSVTKPGNQLSAYCDNDSNAYQKRGKLHLRLIKTDDSETPYKSGRLIIKRAFHFTKGKLVVRAKAPVSAGTWAAIWLNGPKTRKGYFAEIDLMEHVAKMGDDKYEAVYHLWGDFGGKKGNHKSWGKEVPVNVSKWHIYTLEVLDDSIVMKVDNKTRYIIRKGDYGEEWPTDQEYSLRLALAYGGYGASNTGLDDSALPTEMLVDYVRFYPIKKNE